MMARLQEKHAVELWVEQQLLVDVGHHIDCHRDPLGPAISVSALEDDR